MPEFSITWMLILAAALFSGGVYVTLARRNLLMVLMGVELMLNAVNLAFITFARLWGTTGGETGHVFVLMSIGVAAAEVAVGLAMIIAAFRNRQTVDTARMDELKG